MKNNKLILALAAAIPGVAMANIALTDTLAIRGFIDSSYSYQDVDGSPETESINVDAFDIDFLFDGESVDAEVQLNALASNGHDVAIEQAFFTYDFGGGASLTAGKYLSLLGYEGDEPYKLYQYSMAYNIGNSGKIPFAGYHSGVKVSYSNDSFSGTISLVDSVYNGIGEGDAQDLGFEAQVKFTGVENLVVAIGTAQDDQNALAGVDKYWNFWVEYSGIDKLILGAEYNIYELAGMDGDSWMLMGNYAITDTLGATLRYSEVDEDSMTYSGDKFTIAPSYAFSDSLLGVIEYSMGEDGANDYDAFAVELLWTF